jgi:hypothetical protein
MKVIKYIVFACYPTRSDTFHDGGLVDLYLNLISQQYSLSWLIVSFQGGALKETRE